MATAITNTRFRDDPVKWTEERLFAVLGRGTPREQMVTSILGAILAYVLTVFSAGATLLLVVFFTITFWIGAARFAYHWWRS